MRSVSSRARACAESMCFRLRWWSSPVAWFEFQPRAGPLRGAVPRTASTECSWLDWAFSRGALLGEARGPRWGGSGEIPAGGAVRWPCACGRRGGCAGWGDPAEGTRPPPATPALAESRRQVSRDGPAAPPRPRRARSRRAAAGAVARRAGGWGSRRSSRGVRGKNRMRVQVLGFRCYPLYIFPRFSQSDISWLFSSIYLSFL